MTTPRELAQACVSDTVMSTDNIVNRPVSVTGLIFIKL